VAAIADGRDTGNCWMGRQCGSGNNSIIITGIIKWLMIEVAEK